MSGLLTLEISLYLVLFIAVLAIAVAVAVALRLISKNWHLFYPKKVKRSPEEQKKLNERLLFKEHEKFRKVMKGFPHH